MGTRLAFQVPSQVLFFPQSVTTWLANILYVHCLQVSLFLLPFKYWPFPPQPASDFRVCVCVAGNWNDLSQSLLVHDYFGIVFIFIHRRSQSIPLWAFFFHLIQPYFHFNSSFPLPCNSCLLSFFCLFVLSFLCASIVSPQRTLIKANSEWV